MPVELLLKILLSCLEGNYEEAATREITINPQLSVELHYLVLECVKDKQQRDFFLRELQPWLP